MNSIKKQNINNRQHEIIMIITKIKIINISSLNGEKKEKGLQKINNNSIKK